MKRPDVFTELEAAAVGCIALEGTCIRSAYVHAATDSHLR